MAKAKVLDFIEASRTRMTKSEAMRLLLSISPSDRRSNLSHGLSETDVVEALKDKVRRSSSADLDDKDKKDVNDALDYDLREDPVDAPEAPDPRDRYTYQP